ncbi:helix-turn-helix domain-containing protein [Pseudomonas syringae]|nr:helix-turn-helix domain-containing protein [Pseudomonas syringae]
MSLRKAYAATLQWLRIRNGLSQADLQHKADQAHISRLEAATTTPTIDLSADLAQALGLTPLSLLTLVAAADEGKTARSVLHESMIELTRLGVLDETLPGEPQQLTTPQRIAAAERLEAVRKLKAEGLSQAEVCRQLELPRSTVGRLWHIDD